MSHKYLLFALLSLLSVFANPAYASEIGLAGVVGKKAILVINQQSPKTYGVGETSSEGIRLISVDANNQTAAIEFKGQQRKLRVGAVGHLDNLEKEVVLYPSGGGHYFADGKINGGNVRFLVDTGATHIVLGAAQAKSLGISSKGGKKVAGKTANGEATGTLLKLDNVTVGDIKVQYIDAIVLDNDIDTALLGMSFLSQLEVGHNSKKMTLKKAN